MTGGWGVCVYLHFDCLRVVQSNILETERENIMIIIEIDVMYRITKLIRYNACARVSKSAYRKQ